MTFEVYRLNPVTQEFYSLADEIRLRDEILNFEKRCIEFLQGKSNGPISTHHQFVTLTGRDISTPYTGDHTLKMNGVVREIIKENPQPSTSFFSRLFR